MLLNLDKRIIKYQRDFRWWWINSFLSGFPSRSLRLKGLKFLGMKIGDNVRIYEGFHIRAPEKISLGNRVSVGPRVLLDGRRGLTVGNSVVFGYGAIVWTLNHDYNDINFCLKGAPVKIEDFAWICNNSIILPGVTIGEGAVVAANAVVTKNVPPYTVVGGVPAREICKRERKEYNY